MWNVREYRRPRTPEEAWELKRSYGPHAVYLAGGTDLLVNKPSAVDTVIDICHIGLDRISHSNGEIAIGGAALLREVERACEAVAGGMLRSAVRETAPWLIRNAATLTGNIANASPAADSVPPLLALDAKLEVFDGRGQHLVPLDSILEGPHRTTLGDRLICGIVIGARAIAARGAFIKLSRSKSDISQVNVAVVLRLEDGVARDVRIALGAVAPTAIRARRAEAELEGKFPSDEVLRQVEKAVCDEVRPISDWRASADYRRSMSGVLARRALRNALAL